VVLGVGLCLLLTGCIPGDGDHNAANPAGPLWGVWHGWIAPLSLVMHLFDPIYRVYEVNNTGIWYDLGFYVAVISGFGGLSLVRSRR
jgi:hypothetical protein